MLAACFRSHAFPADKVHKAPGNTYGTPGLPDTLWVATDNPASDSYGGESEQGMAIGLLQYSTDSGGSFNPDGSITATGNLVYRLVEFRLPP